MSEPPDTTPAQPLPDRLAAARQLLVQLRHRDAVPLLIEQPGDAEVPPELRLEHELLLMQARTDAGQVVFSDIDEAQRLVERAFLLDSPVLEGDALITSARVLSLLHLFREALAQYGRAEAIALQSGQDDLIWVILHGIGRTLYQAELHPERIEFCERVLRDYPQAPLDLRLNSLTLMASAHKWLGEQQRAAQLYRQALELAEATQAPQLSLILDALANSCAWTGDFEQGWDCLHRCEHITNEALWTADRRLWHEQARALLVWKGGDAAASLPIFQQVVELGRGQVLMRPGLIAGLTRLAEAAEEAGRVDLALAASRELLDLTNERSREQTETHGAALSSMVKAARLEVEKHHVEEQREWLEARVAERTEELSTALGRLQAEMEIRRATELALQQAHDELELRVQQRTAELEQAMHLLMQREKLAALGHLVAGVAHELNTPIGNARLAASSLLSESMALRAQVQAQSLRRTQLEQSLAMISEGSGLVDHSLERAGMLIERLKSAARPELSGSKPEKLDLAARVSDRIALLQAGMDSAIRWELSIEQPLPAMLDGEAFLQVLAQLVENAWVHAMAARGGGLLRIRLQRASDDRALLQVADDGPGIPAEQLGRVFEPFFSTRFGQGSSGLGLHRAHSLAVEVLNGSLTAHSPTNGGALFELRVPLSAPPGQT